MTKLREAAKQALEVLEMYSEKLDSQFCEKAIKDLRAALAEPVQEPVAWLQPRTLDSYMRPDLGYETCSKSDYGAFPVYTSPPQRKPLTDEEIKNAVENCGIDTQFIPRTCVLVARAIEQAHGIKEET